MGSWHAHSVHSAGTDLGNRLRFIFLKWATSQLCVDEKKKNFELWPIREIQATKKMAPLLRPALFL